jgi:hypothetical protein
VTAGEAAAPSDERVSLELVPFVALELGRNPLCAVLGERAQFVKRVHATARLSNNGGCHSLEVVAHGGCVLYLPSAVPLELPEGSTCSLRVGEHGLVLCLSKVGAKEACAYLCRALGSCQPLPDGGGEAAASEKTPAAQKPPQEKTGQFQEFRAVQLEEPGAAALDFEEGEPVNTPGSGSARRKRKQPQHHKPLSACR